MLKGAISLLPPDLVWETWRFWQLYSSEGDATSLFKHLQYITELFLSLPSVEVPSSLLQDVQDKVGETTNMCVRWITSGLCQWHLHGWINKDGNQALDAYSRTGHTYILNVCISIYRLWEAKSLKRKPTRACALPMILSWVIKIF